MSETERARAHLSVIEPSLEGVALVNGPVSLLGSALAHLCGLLRSLIVVREAGQAVAAGLIVRAAWETWLVAQYLSYGLNEAMDTLHGQFLRSTRIIHERRPEGGDAVERDLRERDIKLEQMLKFVVAARARVGHPMSAQSASSYDTIYRGASLMDAHPGWGVLIRYQRIVDGHFEVSLEPRGASSAESDLAVVIDWLSETAHEWFLNTNRLDLDEQLLSIR